MPERRPLIAGNWKMHLGVADTGSFLERLLREQPSPLVDVVVCPPFLSLPAAAAMLHGSDIGLGAQNVHWQRSGAFTGEVAATMLSEIGVRWVIVGHSERRALFAETDETAMQRAHQAQANGLQVIYCLGETIEQRQRDETFAVLERQSKRLGELRAEQLVVAYEPVWAIGTGHTASPAQAQEAHAFLRSQLAAQLGAEAAAGIRLLYGGSLKPNNANELLAQPDVDGGLIGGASLDVDSFSAIIRAAADCAAGAST